MKYIKLFENITYYPISEEEFDNMGTSEPFTDNEYQVISDLLNTIFTDIEISYVISAVVPKSIIQTRMYFDEVFAIWKFTDEWYFVADSNMRHYYKCDQFDGLINCIKNIA